MRDFFGYNRKVFKVEVTPQDMGASRFAISPLVETMQARWMLEGRVPAGMLRRWADRWREPYRELEGRHPALRSASAISGHKGTANVDFLAPPPTGLSVPFEVELAAMRGTPVAQAHAEISAALAARPPVPAWMRELLLGPDVVRLLADAFEVLWREIISLEWPRFQAVLEREVVHRAGQLATYGWARALDDLSPQVRWNPVGRIELDLYSPDSTHRLGGKGLLFLPSVFSHRVGAYLSDDWPYALVYPARGIAAEPPSTSAGLAGLIGRSRARILRELAVPATTTQLAALLGLALGTTGEHVTALRRAGLVTGTRTGRSVLYVRTPLGEALSEV